MIEPQLLRPAPIAEVHLPQAPLARVIAQVRFPSILAIRNPDKAAVFQEALRETYPYLRQEQVHGIDLTQQRNPNISEQIIWRLGDQDQDPQWKISLAVDFVALETSNYDSRRDFLERLRTVVGAVHATFKPAKINRLGVRYIDQLTGGAINRIADLVQPSILGIMGPVNDGQSPLGDSIEHVMTQAQFLAEGGNRILGRWGMLSKNTTYDPGSLAPVSEPSWVLDLDMSTTAPKPFESDELLATVTYFTQSLYWLFRQMVTDEFLTYYGGTP